MQNSCSFRTIRDADHDNFFAVTYSRPVAYETCAILFLDTSGRPPGGLLHDISKTGLVHAKHIVLGIKRLANCDVFAISVGWTTLRRLLFPSRPPPWERGRVRSATGGLLWSIRPSPSKANCVRQRARNRRREPLSYHSLSFLRNGAGGSDKNSRLPECLKEPPMTPPSSGGSQ
jgi:hypothetical protein